MKLFILFSFGGGLYSIVEILYKHDTHWSMFILGGLCFLLVGGLNKIYTDMPLVVQMGISSLIITALEFLCGCIVNIWLGWEVWNYDALPLNLFGQICIYFTVIWFFLSLVGIFVEDFLRWQLFYEKMPAYSIIKRKA
ncbi:MAG: hypothetical protein J1E39_01845 [Eubacterium sp.]|nr:hypothetical protein [Eubacterium sp.]